MWPIKSIAIASFSRFPANTQRYPNRNEDLAFVQFNISAGTYYNDLLFLDLYGMVVFYSLRTFRPEASIQLEHEAVVSISGC